MSRPFGGCPATAPLPKNEPFVIGVVPIADGRELEVRECRLPDSEGDGGSRVKDNLRAIGHYLEGQRSALGEAVPAQMFQTVRANIDKPY